MLLAQQRTVPDIFGNITPPLPISQFGSGATGINALLNNVVGIFFAAGAIAFIIMFVWGAVQMILSGGDKEAISKARAKITWAIIGVILMSLSYFVFQLLEAITGFKFFV
jgi:hypothetical protein